jgi:hypothetical protein
MAALPNGTRLNCTTSNQKQLVVRMLLPGSARRAQLGPTTKERLGGCAPQPRCLSTRRKLDPTPPTPLPSQHPVYLRPRTSASGATSTPAMKGPLRYSTVLVAGTSGPVTVDAEFVTEIARHAQPDLDGVDRRTGLLAPAYDLAAIRLRADRSQRLGVARAEQPQLRMSRPDSPSAWRRIPFMNDLRRRNVVRQSSALSRAMAETSFSVGGANSPDPPDLRQPAPIEHGWWIATSRRILPAR